MDVDRIASRIIADVAPAWVMSDLVNSLDVSGTILKKFTGKHSGVAIWVLKGESKIYKDRFGTISTSWSVNPWFENGWSIRSVLSFAPATSGSFANEKFGEFKQSIPISGKKEFGVFGIENWAIEIVPNQDSAIREINSVIATHNQDLNNAKKFWKQQAISFKQKYGML